MLKTLSVGVLLCGFGVAAAVADDIQWKAGTLTNMKDVHGTRENGKNGAASEVPVTTTFFTIDAGDAVYVLARRLGKRLGRRDKELNLTVNSSVRFGVKKDKYYLVDADGKTHEVFLEGKTEKAPAAQPAMGKP